MAVKNKQSVRERSITGEEFIARLSPELRARGEARAARLIAEETTLQDLRRANAMTQTRLASLLGIGQEQVSRIEQRTDMLLSTLASYVEAMGGKLEFVVTFPNRPPAVLSGLGDVFTPESKPSPRKRAKVAQAKARPAKAVREKAPAK